jgi:hypothetical protein
MIREMDLVLITMQVEINMKECTRMICFMGWANTHSKMEKHKKENGLMMKNKE